MTVAALADLQAMRTLPASLQRLQAPLGLIAVLGNHDWWGDPDAQATRRTLIIAAQELRAAGITALETKSFSSAIAGRG